MSVCLNPSFNFGIAVYVLCVFLKYSSERNSGTFKMLSSSCFSLLVLSMPDTVEEMCPEMPRLDRLLKDVSDVSESGARYSDMPQV